MMAKCKSIGIDDYINGITRLSSQIEPIAGRCIYEGAAIVADEIRAEINAIPTRSGTKEPFEGLLQVQKEGLQDGLGISHADNKNGIKNVKIGFNGYNALETKKYPNGQPNVLIARSIVKGTSWQIKDNFVQRAVKRAKPKAEAAMKKTFDEEFAKINK